MRFRPCIDLKGGNVTQIVGGSLIDGGESTVENFRTSKPASEFAAMYMRDGLVGGHVIKLGPGNDEAALSALRAYPSGLQIGGGITDENAKMWLEAGASHVIVTSFVFSDGELSWDKLARLVSCVGKERLVLDLSCRKREGEYFVVTDRWQKFTELQVSKDTLERLGTHCAEFLVHGVDVEGLRTGIDDELVRRLGEWSPVPVTYAGGATSLADLDNVLKLGQGRVDLTIGSALDIFGGDVRYQDVVLWDKAQQDKQS
mmetsp:Transcript_60204/g.130746  ORF Transcript_60204/g.130746 Transcript_60204/m.130746 type:complete len:258 (-) Transcript_60204:14-787(-)